MWFSIKWWWRQCKLEKLQKQEARLLAMLNEERGCLPNIPFYRGDLAVVQFKIAKLKEKM
jgi:hypothetical protein